MLKQAKRGELSAVAIAMVLRDGTSDWAHSEVPSISTMVGAIERMKLDLALGRSE